MLSPGPGLPGCLQWAGRPGGTVTVTVTIDHDNPALGPGSPGPGGRPRQLSPEPVDGLGQSSLPGAGDRDLVTRMMQ